MSAPLLSLLIFLPLAAAGLLWLLPARAARYLVADATGIGAGLRPGSSLTVHARKDGSVKTFQVAARVETPIEVEYYRHGGILPYVVRKLAESRQSA